MGIGKSQLEGTPFQWEMRHAENWDFPFPNDHNDQFFFSHTIQYHTVIDRKDTEIYQGSYRQVHVKFKDFSRTSKILSYCFQGLKSYEKYWFTCLNSTSEMLKSITKDISFRKSV